VVQAASPFDLAGRRILLIDTPGFDDTTKSDTDILKEIGAFLSQTYEKGMYLSGVIYMHRISDFRMGGISRRNFNMFRQLCGDDSLVNVLIVTNMWGEVGLEVGEAREAELRDKDLFFKPALDKGARLIRHLNTFDSARAIIHCIIDNHPMALQIQHELVDEQLNLSQTAAGTELNRELMEQAQRHEEELKEIRAEMATAITKKDDETKQELEEVVQKLTSEVLRVQADARKLELGYNEEKARVEQKMQEMLETSSKMAAEYQRQIQALENQLQEAAKTSAVEKDVIQKQMDDLQRKYESTATQNGGCVIL